ncbi:MAG: sigma-70 family RNA polymerase sigma factor [Proteobacteria bacterium]|nr:sigma-70 family RNA polymerase sigma factor [Pseudomonadota bacterium]
MPRFQSTQWSIVLCARGGDAQARDALEALCRTYRPPVLAYIRSHPGAADEAEDLAQAFFVEFIAAAAHAHADPARGRFRSFLLTTLKHFLLNAGAAARALKRGGGMQFSSLDDPIVAGDIAAAADTSPERVFERSWALTVIDAAMHALRAEAEAAGKQVLFAHLREFLVEPPDEADYARLSQQLGLRRNTLAVTVHRLRRRLRELVQAELARTTDGREALAAEMRDLRSVLADVME